MKKKNYKWGFLRETKQKAIDSGLDDYITLNVPFVAVSNVPLQTWSF